MRAIPGPAVTIGKGRVFGGGGTKKTRQDQKDQV